MLDISNVINISVAEAPLGLGDYNVNNVALFTDESPIPEDYGDYGVYVSPSAVATDFGSDSETYAQAVAFFSQNPNVLNGGGSLIIFPVNTSTNGKISTFEVYTAGSGYAVNDVLTVGGAGTGGTLKVTDVDSNGAVLSASLLTPGSGYAVASNLSTTVAPSGGTGCKISVTAISNIETLQEAFLRVKDLIFFVGVISTFLPATDEEAQDFSDTIQSEPLKMWVFPSDDTADIAGIFTDIKEASNYKTRCLLYTTSIEDARLMAAAYAGKGFSVNFDASNATITMNLKNLTTIEPDEGITQTIWANAKTAGVDLYVSYAGVPSVVSNGANRFFDQVYNLIWFVSQLQVNGFNALRQTASKVPQTEPGITLLKDAYRQVCEQALNNSYIAPGAWNSPERFGNPEDMLANILQRGYYIYSQPVNQQSQTDREDRKAPIIRIAVKEAGAVQESSVIVNVNA